MAEYIVDYELIPLKWRDGYGLSDIDLTEEIVRCRDCKYAVDNDWFGYLQCNRPPDGDGGCLRVPTEPDGFCAWGERK